MTPGAQIAAGIELLEMLEAAWQEGKLSPADAVIGHYFRSRRYIGSKDKGAISRLVYRVLRHGASLQWWVERFGLKAEPRTLALAALAIEDKLPAETVIGYFSGTGYEPSPLTPKERKFVSTPHDEADAQAMPEWMRLNVPEWCLSHLREVFPPDELAAEIAALNREAPLDLRVNTLKTTREKVQAALAKEGFHAAPTPYSPWGLRLQRRGAIFATHTFRNGWVEVQDEGSQLAALLVDAKPGQKVIDFCAGAGGKTLALAAMMRNKGRILAWDTSQTRLEQSPKRFRRAGADNIQRHLITSEHDSYIKRHKATADRVLVDAPCSGSGTWRRNPDLKWRFQPSDLDEILTSQRAILESAARLVKPGGRLVYVTCSLFPLENEHQLDQFLEAHSQFRVVMPEEIWDKKTMPFQVSETRFFRLTPERHETDGFFIAVLEKTAAS